MNQIGAYKVLGELGRGGAGVVFKALSPHGRPVAVKVLLHGRGAPPRQRKRFEREARALAKVDHSNVVKLLDLGEHRGAPFVVTEFHEYGSLAENLRTTTLSPHMALKVGCQLAEGLAAIHAVGVLHPDLKPDNVLIDKRLQPLITDFGLAKDLDRTGETQRLTKSGIFLGTPGYWAPEQAAGKVGEVGPATDIYGLGATLYAALTGRPPIVGDSLIQVVTATTDDAPPPIRTLCPDVPEQLAEIITRCLEKAPDDRWPNAVTLSQALRTCSLEASPAPASRRWRLLVGASVVLIGIGALFALGGQGEGRSEALPSVDKERPKDTLSKIDRLSKAAEAGDVEAMANLGVALRGGVSRDDALAARWLRRAAEAGNPLAMTHLGNLLFDGLGVEKDWKQAGEWHRRAAELGHKKGMIHWAVMLQSGRGVAKDEAQAAVWWRRAAEQGQGFAMYSLGDMLLKGSGVAKDDEQGVAWWRRSAETGFQPAMYGLGVMLVTGRGVAKDEAEAVLWWRRAAKKGHKEAMTSLALMLREGRGVAKDEAQAVVWWRRAAKEGHKEAMTHLGVMLKAGRGVAKDEAQAAVWWRRAAEKGDQEAMIHLGNMHALGRGAAKDEAQAATWFRRAAQAGPRHRQLAIDALSKLGQQP